MDGISSAISMRGTVKLNWYTRFFSILRTSMLSILHAWYPIRLAKPMSAESIILPQSVPLSPCKYARFGVCLQSFTAYFYQPPTVHAMRRIQRLASPQMHESGRFSITSWPVREVMIYLLWCHGFCIFICYFIDRLAKHLLGLGCPSKLLGGVCVYRLSVLWWEYQIENLPDEVPARSALSLVM